MGRKSRKRRAAGFRPRRKAKCPSLPHPPHASTEREERRGKRYFSRLSSIHKKEDTGGGGGGHRSSISISKGLNHPCLVQLSRRKENKKGEGGLLLSRPPPEGENKRPCKGRTPSTRPKDVFFVHLVNLATKEKKRGERFQVTFKGKVKIFHVKEKMGGRDRLPFFVKGSFPLS